MMFYIIFLVFLVANSSWLWANLQFSSNLQDPCIHYLQLLIPAKAWFLILAGGREWTYSKALCSAPPPSLCIVPYLSRSSTPPISWCQHLWLSQTVLLGGGECLPIVHMNSMNSIGGYLGVGNLCPVSWWGFIRTVVTWDYWLSP